MAELSQILDDLIAEHEALDAVVSDLRADEWLTDTPAAGWTIRDQISHLAFFDERAAEAASDPEAFMEGVGRAAADPDAYMEEATGRDRPGSALEWWRSARSSMIEAVRPLDARTRVQWYGPPMSAASFATARLMETWAHGQDVYDALGLAREPTERLRHIAHLGVRTRGFSFTNRGLRAPDDEVRVELVAPSGDVWTWGPSEAVAKVEGPAEDFCLVVAQRRHLDDTGIHTKGSAAEEWMRLAQAFAGPPGAGREPESGE